MIQVETIYFLGGLGSNKLFTKDLERTLENIKLKQIDLPGLGGEYDVEVNNIEDLLQWFESKVDIKENFILMGHSLGADLVLLLKHHISYTKRIILLDGGIVNLDDFEYSLKNEVEDLINFVDSSEYSTLDEYLIKEKEDYIIWTKNILRASIAKMVFNLNKQKYCLSINVDKTINLLKLRRQVKRSYLKMLNNEDTLILLPENQSKEIEEYKKNIIENECNLDYKLVEKSGHDIYIDNPKEVGEIINEWVYK